MGITRGSRIKPTNMTDSDAIFVVMNDYEAEDIATQPVKMRKARDYELEDMAIGLVIVILIVLGSLS